MDQKVILLKGLPASGKTTWAIQFCKDNPKFRRINKDDIRSEFGNPVWTKEFEQLVLDTQRERGLDYIKNGFSIIVDDTNFAEKHRQYWSKICLERHLIFEEKYFDTPVDTCIDRDNHREKKVGEGVIRDMYKKHVKHKISKFDNRFILNQNHNLPKCIICDIDGTLALINGRSPYDDSLIHTDKVNEDVRKLLWRYKSQGVTVIILSGRMDKCQIQTEKWLQDNSIYYDKIYMRKTDDFRQDAVVKKEIYEEHIKDKYYVESVLDDRDQVVKMWRELGLLCLQVYYGDF